MARRRGDVRERQSDAAWLFGGLMFFVMFFGALLLLALASGSI